MEQDDSSEKFVVGALAFMIIVTICSIVVAVFTG